MRIFLLLVTLVAFMFIGVTFFYESNTESVTSSQSRNGDGGTTITPSAKPNNFMDMGIQTTARADLPLAGSSPTENVKHSIPLEEIRRGCFRQDCIPSVDTPEFVNVTQANEILPEDTIGIALSHKGIDRFYPFNMLVTREIVNEVIAGDPLLVTYCPLCGTGIVFERSVNGVVYDFGVSGMLWQSNLLMYNRAENIEDRSLWSQVLGRAVVGNHTGTELRVVPSDIMQYTTWRESYPEGQVLNTGRIGDPYDGQYFAVAESFNPNFDTTTSELDPSTYVYGIRVGTNYRAYERELLPEGQTIDEVGGEIITITRAGEQVSFSDSTGTIADIEGFWFSWKAAYPETTLWQPRI
ncbi:MAG: DUF3179 domain-containing (seleno)protein [Bacteroidota bacterium]